MSNLIRINELAYAVGGNLLFNDLEVALNTGDRVGLVGHNGCGKSSLLSIIAHRTEPEQGTVQFQRGLRVMEVEQFLPQELNTKNLVEALDAETWRAEALLGQLGFDNRTLSLPVAALSGGQQNRLMFARAVVHEPDVLLLDEPTNHLDLHTMVLFESYLQNLNAAFVLVSHDRSFLDTVTTRTWVLRDQRIYQYGLPYSEARAALEHHDEATAHTLEVEEKKIDALRASAKRLNMWGKVYDNEKLAKRGRAMDRRADKLEANKTFATRGSPLSLSLKLGATRAKEIVRVENYTVQVADFALFHIDEFLIRPGERVALLGHNGVGKSTFIRALVAADDQGITLRPQTELGYYDQELDEIRGNVSMQAFVRKRVDVKDDEVRRRLIHAGFPYNQQDKRIGDLSGGERARVLFVVLSLQAPNFLILDEPTNHIDLEGKEQLENQLCDGDTAVLMTSHDRRFIETVAERYVWINDGRLIEINEPEEFFRSTPLTEPTPTSPPFSTPEAASTSLAETAQQEQIERLLELEEILAADLGRKPKHQKPALHADWRSEIDDLYRLLDQ
jgi:ATP-binding cassette subfamily F protein 3